MASRENLRNDWSITINDRDRNKIRLKEASERGEYLKNMHCTNCTTYITASIPIGKDHEHFRAKRACPHCGCKRLVPDSIRCLDHNWFGYKDREPITQGE